jgi:hypothetical protein
MGEVGGVQSRLDPPSYSVCYTKCRGIGVSHLAEEESILAASRSLPLVYGLFAFAQVLNLATAGVVQWSCEEVLLGIEAILLGRVGCRDMVGILRRARPVV